MSNLKSAKEILLAIIADKLFRFKDDSQCAVALTNDVEYLVTSSSACLRASHAIGFLLLVNQKRLVLELFDSLFQDLERTAHSLWNKTSKSHVSNSGPILNEVLVTQLVNKGFSR